MRQAGDGEVDVVLKPVDSNDYTILNSEIKVDGVDADFRPVRDWKGVTRRLKPGTYTVRVVLPNLDLKSFRIKITADVHTYRLPIQADYKNTRREPRVSVSLAAAYWSSTGSWIRTRSVNLSSGGACLLTRNQKPDQDLHVRLFVPICADPVECPARLRWTKTEGTSQMGLELFLPDNIKSSLSQWLSDVHTTPQ